MVSKEISYMWNSGSLLSGLYVLMVVSGLNLGMGLGWNVMESGNESVMSEFLMMQVGSATLSSFGGWRVTHSSSCCLVAGVMYMHIGRGLWVSGEKKKGVFKSGVSVMVSFMSAAFFGYVIPMGQMSLWGCSVIVSLFSVIPLVGDQVVYVLWGGYGISFLTSSRFLMLHMLMVVVMSGMVAVHIMMLHAYFLWGSNLSENGKANELISVYIVKDGVTWSMGSMILSVSSVYAPFVNMDPDNWMVGDSSITPHNIKPEWYFLISYAVLRCIPSKVSGALGLLGSILWLAGVSFSKGENNALSEGGSGVVSKMMMVLSVSVLWTLLLMSSVPASENVVYVSAVMGVSGCGVLSGVVSG